MTETAKMYGGSLYDLAAEEGLETRILGELDEAVAYRKLRAMGVEIDALSEEQKEYLGV